MITAEGTLHPKVEHSVASISLADERMLAECGDLRIGFDSDPTLKRATPKRFQAAIGFGTSHVIAVSTVRSATIGRSRKTELARHDRSRRIRRAPGSHGAHAVVFCK